MNFTDAYFEVAFGTSSQLPKSDVPEFCFAGRSNVGKSSLINKILGRKALARVSSTPGKTVTVNFYKLKDLRIVDLPGYGFAKVASKEKERWSELMEGYFRQGRNIAMCFSLIDMRRPATEFDISMIEFLRHYNIPYTVVLTKCDKLNKTEYNKRLEAFRDELGENVQVVPFSALKGDGTEELRNIIEQNLNGDV